MTIDTETKTRENRLRRKASLYGLRLTKSRRRDPDALNYGLYALIDEQTGGAVNPILIGRFVHSWDLDDVEAYLISDDDEPAPARKAIKAAARAPVPERLEDPAGRSAASSALKKKTGQIESKETARDVYMRASLTNPRFKLLPESGETFTIVGARPPTK